VLTVCAELLYDHIPISASPGRRQMNSFGPPSKLPDALTM
jgi:hypothetical protein